MYKYDNEGKVVYSYVYDSETYTNLNGTRVVYDDQSRVFSIFHSFDYKTSSGVADDTTHYNYNYNAETGNLAKLKADGAYFSGEIIPTYDKFGRTENKTIDFSVNGSKAFYNKLIYDYVTNADSESVLVSQLISQVGKTSSSTTSTTYNYTYDNNGNITQITNASGVIQNKYYYDALGQLVREDNRALNSTYTYSYDNAGNITAKKRYAFTTGTLGSVLNTFSYTYGDSTWKDLLTNYNGTSISYDTIGNPVMIDNAELTWQGRTLTEYYNGDYEYLNFGYNADGIRTSKEYSCPETGAYGKHTYVLNGSQIVSETYTYEDYDGNVENWTIVYIYDETGSPIGMKYREPYYAAGVYDCFFFEKNLQGDIVAVYDATGTKLLTYDYDAWGNCTESDASQFSARGANYNPFRYRGYYYDRETGWYYLQSRYYNPEWGRFLNADAYLNANGDIVGFNMYAYCSNNPVSNYDPMGEGLLGLLALGANRFVTDSIIDSGGSSQDDSPKSIKYDVPLFKQGNKPLCWAYCMIMIDCYKSGVSISQKEADLKAMDLAYKKLGKDNWDKGFFPDNAGDAVKMNSIIDLYKALVEYGPLYVYYRNSSTHVAHLVVITGVDVDIGYVYTNNPWGVKGKQTFEAFKNGVAKKWWENGDGMKLYSVHTIK